MRKIIDKKVYNTETAELLGEWDNGLYGNDFRAVQEKLYITKKGQYFIHAWGGAMSKYGRPCGNGMTDDEDIILLSKEKAEDWAIDKLSTTTVEEIFGEFEQG